MPNIALLGGPLRLASIVMLRRLVAGSTALDHRLCRRSTFGKLASDSALAGSTRRRPGHHTEAGEARDHAGSFPRLPGLFLEEPLAAGFIRLDGTVDAR